MQSKTIRLLMIALAAGFYIASLLLPAFSFTSHVPPDTIVGQVEIYPGWFVLAFGPIGVVFLELPAISWLANSSFLIGMLLYGFRRDGSAAILAMASAVLGASFFWISKSRPMLVLFSGRGDLINHPVPMLGFFFWMGAFAILFLGSGLGKFVRGDRLSEKP